MQTAIIVMLLLELLLLSPLTECALTFAVTEKCEVDDTSPWSYHGEFNGPSGWGETYTDCYGKMQSPVEINSETAKPDPALPKLKMENYETPITKANIVNNGRTVRITPQDGVSRTIQAEGKTFTLQQLHFHWGIQYYEGSEHSLNEQKYAMEGHLVHTGEQNEIAVVAVLFKVTDSNNTALKSITDALPNIPYKENEVQLTSDLNLNDFVSQNPSSFYRYLGSLTTPGCSEGVIWSILTGIQPVGAQQWYEFRNLYSVTKEEATPGCKIINNFRPRQPLNDRIIYSSQ